MKEMIFQERFPFLLPNLHSVTVRLLKAKAAAGRWLVSDLELAARLSQIQAGQVVVGKRRFQVVGLIHSLPPVAATN
jgi:hypothetical protein